MLCTKYLGSENFSVDNQLGRYNCMDGTLERGQRQLKTLTSHNNASFSLFQWKFSSDIIDFYFAIRLEQQDITKWL